MDSEAKFKLTFTGSNNLLIEKNAAVKWSDLLRAIGNEIDRQRLEEMAFPDLARTFKRMDICIELQSIPATSHVATEIIQAARFGQLNVAINLVMQIAGPERRFAIDLIGKDLLKKIEDYLKEK